MESQACHNSCHRNHTASSEFPSIQPTPRDQRAKPVTNFGNRISHLIAQALR
jgi:hypothetical protein